MFPETSFEDCFIHRGGCRGLVRVIYNIAYVYQSGSDLFSQGERETERERRGQDLCVDLCFTLRNPLGQFHFFFAAQEGNGSQILEIK